MAKAKRAEHIEPSSGNVFADLGLPDAVGSDVKVRLAVELVRTLDTRELSQVDAAKALRIDQPKLSALRRYELDGLSVGHLLTFLTALGHDVEIRVTARRKNAAPGRIRVEAV